MSTTGCDARGNIIATELLQHEGYYPCRMRTLRVVANTYLSEGIVDMGVMLINPPSSFLMDEKVHPPLGLLYLATYISEHEKSLGSHVRVVDLAGIAPNLWKDELCKCALTMYDVDLIGVTATTPQFTSAVKLKGLCKRLFPHVPVVIGGAHATVDTDSCMMFNHVVVGEGEAALRDWRSWKTKVVRYGTLPDVDSIPYPDRDFIDVASYHYYVGETAATTVMTSRGCPYDCAFCCHPWGRKVRMHSPHYVAGEVAYLKQKYGYNAFMFFDDIFVLPRKRIREMTRLLKDLDVIYRCFVRSDVVDDELMSMLHNSGCVEIGFGAESGSQAILDAVGKHNSVGKNTELVELARRHGIRTKAFMIVGLPGETHKTCKETYDWLNNVHPDSWDVSIYTPYKGSNITKYPEQYDIYIDHQAFKDAWYKGTPGKYHCCVSTDALSSSDIIEWREKIEQELGSQRYDRQ